MIRCKFVVATMMVFVLASIFIGCSGSGDEADVNDDYLASGYDVAKANTEYEYSESLDGSGTDETNAFGEKMIYTARILIETLSFEITLENIDGYVASVGGYVENSSISGIGANYESSSVTKGYAELTYRIPADQYNYFMNNIKEYGNVIYQNSISNDITLAYYDIEGRLNAYRIAEERLLQILSKAEEIKDMLEIERELKNVRADIESMTTQIRSWDNRVDYSTIVITIKEVIKITDISEPDSFWQRFIKAAEKSFIGFAEFIKDAVIIIVYILPYALIALLIFIVIKIIKKKRGCPFFSRKTKKEK